MFQNLSQAFFCLGSQKREEIRYFSSRLQPCSFQHCTALFSSCSQWSRSVALVLRWIDTWIFMSSDVTRSTAMTLYEFCMKCTKVIQCARWQSCTVTTWIFITQSSLAPMLPIAIIASKNWITQCSAGTNGVANETKNTLFLPFFENLDRRQLERGFETYY